jgi:phospholipid transport system substrate-binding protein
MTKTYFAASVLAFSLLFQPVFGAEDQTNGTAVVEKLHSALMRLMVEADALGYQGRVDAITPVLNETFDFATISRIVTGAYWKSLDEAARERFAELFSRLSAATYASNFDGYSGEQFETVSVEEKRGGLLVKTAIVKSNGERISLDYILRDDAGRWRIVNVIAQGVSDLSLKRADYTAVIKSEGFDSLVAKLNGKVADYRSSGK